ncbi:MAG: hypothetical protein ACLS4Z_11880 [Christensenellaceae bacterium]
MNERVTESVMLDKLASDLNLEIIYTGRGVVTLSSMSVERPGLQLAGFFSYFDPRRIMVFGLSSTSICVPFLGGRRESCRGRSITARCHASFCRDSPPPEL